MGRMFLCIRQAVVQLPAILHEAALMGQSSEAYSPSVGLTQSAAVQILLDQWRQAIPTGNRQRLPSMNSRCRGISSLAL